MPVGDRYSVGIRAKIMILYQDGFAIPLGAGVFEVANWFRLLRIDTDEITEISSTTDKSFEDAIQVGCSTMRRQGP